MLAASVMTKNRLSLNRNFDESWVDPKISIDWYNGTPSSGYWSRLMIKKM